MRPTATVTIAPVMPPPAALPSAVPMSTPPLAAPPRAGIKLCRIVPPIPPPTAPDIVLSRGTQDYIFEKAADGISANRPAHDLDNEVDYRSGHFYLPLLSLRIELRCRSIDVWCLEIAY